MALPTRVSRGVATDPFEIVQRDFDHLLGRLFNGSQTDGRRRTPRAVRRGHPRGPGPLLRRGRTARLQEGRHRHHAGKPDPDHLRRAPRGEGKPATGRKGELLLHERRYSRFLRSFTLPPTVDEQTVNAKLTDGVLTITLNKREETKPRKIQVA